MIMDPNKPECDNNDEPISNEILQKLQTPGEGKACAMICGDPEVIEQLIQSILGMADVADDHGMCEEADALTALLSDVKMMKAAQYEGAQNYWIANGRAFELSFKQRYESQKEDKKSFHEAWMATLQDYMDSLLGPQTEYIGKSLKTAQYEGFQNHWLMNSRAFELAFKNKLEAQSEKEKSFFKAWMEVLEDYQESEERQKFLHDALKKTASKSENDMAMTVLAEAERRKVALADLYCEWTGCHKEALTGFLVMASKKIEHGENPAIAVYEALDFYASGAHSRNTIRRVQALANKIETELIKNAAFTDTIRNMWWNWKTTLMNVWDRVTFRHGVGSKILNKITAMGNWFTKVYDGIKSKLSASPTAAVSPAYLNHAIGPYVEEVRNLVNLVNTPGSAARISKMPELFVGGSPNPEYFDPELNGIGEQQYDDYMSKLANVLFQVRSAAQEYDKSAREGIVDAPPVAKVGQFEQIINNAIVVSTQELAGMLSQFEFSAGIDLKKMVDEVEKATPPWSVRFEQEAQKAGVSQGKIESSSSINLAARSITSAYMGIIDPYIQRIRMEIQNSKMNDAAKNKAKEAIQRIVRDHSGVTKKEIEKLMAEKFNLEG
jgi:hypothetical protein